MYFFLNKAYNLDLLNEILLNVYEKYSRYTVEILYKINQNGNSNNIFFFKHLNINSPELFGFLFAGDLYIGYTKDRDVGGVARDEQAALLELDARSRQAGAFPDGRGHVDDLVFPDELLEEAREGSVGTRVGQFLAQRAFR